MNCNKCGEPLTEGSKFCAVCGTPVQSSPHTSASAATDSNQSADPVITASAAPVISASSAPVKAPKSTNKKPLLIAVIAVAVLAVLAAGAYLAFNYFSNSGSGSSSDKPSYLLVIKGEDEVQIYAGDKKPVTIDGRADRSVYTNDGRKVAVSIDVDENGLGELWYSDGKKAEDIADSVYNFAFSASGTRIAYLTDYDYESGVGDLYVYDIQTKKSEQIAQEASTDFTLSPDGKSIGYTSDISIDDNGYVDSYKGYLCINGGKAEEIGDNLYVFAISNDAKYVYYVETDPASPDTGDLYIRHGKTDDKIGSVNLYSAFYLNNDCSELVFVKSGSTYLCADGKDKEKISDMALSAVVAVDGTQYSSNNSSSVYAVTLNINSFSEQLLAVTDDSGSGTTLTYLKKDLTTEDIDDLNDYYYMYNMNLESNGKTLYYLNDSGQILKYKDYRDHETDPEKIKSDEDIIYYIVMPDQSAIYYIDAQQTLWVQRGTSDPEEIASDVQTYSLNVSKDEKGIYYICDFKAADDNDEYAGGGTLNYIKNAAKAKSSEIADNVYSIEVHDYGTVYYVYDATDESTGSYVGEAFFSLNDKDFTSVMDNAFFG